MIAPFRLTVAALTAFSLTSLFGQTFEIETVAGQDFYNEGGDPRQARLNGPWGVALRPNGDLCFSDGNHFRIRCIENGAIHTIAGRGGLGVSGDGGPALEAELIEPRGIAIGPDGSIYVADQIDLVVRRIAPNGTISVFAGTGESGTAGENGPATAAELSNPNDVAVDSAGNVYIADPFADRVLVVGADGVLRRFAGSGRTGFSGEGGPAGSAHMSDPSDVAVGPAGVVYIADGSNHRVRRVGADGVIRTVVGTGQSGFFGDGGSPLQARLNRPAALAVGPDGTLYVADAGHRVRAVNFTADVITTVAGNGESAFAGEGPATERAVPQPAGLAVGTGGALFIASESGNRVLRVMGGQLTVVAGRDHFSGDGGQARQASLGRVDGISSGSILIADAGNRRVRRINDAGVIQTIAGNGSSASSGDGGPATAAGMSPVDVLREPDGNILALDANGFIRRIRADGTIQRIAGTGELELGPPREGVPALQASLGLPFRIGRDGQGNIYVLQAIFVGEITTIVRRITPAGTIQTVFGGGNNVREGALGLQVALPFSTELAVGADGRICVTDDLLFRVRCLETNGAVRTVAGLRDTESLTPEGLLQIIPYLTSGVELGPDNEVYFSEIMTHQIYRVRPGELPEAIAGAGEYGFSGDGGPALSARLNTPDGLALDDQGRLLVWDRQNWRLRRLTPVEPTVQAAAIANAASFVGGPTAAGAIVSLFGVERREHGGRHRTAAAHDARRGQRPGDRQRRRGARGEAVLRLAGADQSGDPDRYGGGRGDAARDDAGRNRGSRHRRRAFRAGPVRHQRQRQGAGGGGRHPRGDGRRTDGGPGL